jgi:hypothetical protein
VAVLPLVGEDFVQGRSEGLFGDCSYLKTQTDPSGFDLDGVVILFGEDGETE